MNSAGPTPSLRYEHDEDGRLHYLHAHLADGSEPNQVGVMIWHVRNGMFLETDVDERYRRRGIATALWREAVHRKFTPPVQMTANRTDEGHAWAVTLSTGVERAEGFDLEAALRGDY